MRVVVHFQEMIHGQMRVFLRGIDRGVPQHFLDGPKIGTFIEQMSREGMTKRMGTHPASGQSARIAGYDSFDAARRQTAPAVIEKDRHLLLDGQRRRLMKRGLNGRAIGFDRRQRHRPDRNETLFSPFPSETDQTVRAVYIIHI
jgi:hypothetical protein